jgi:hypothetical protein
MTLQMPLSLTEWVTDSDASNHTTPDPGNVSLSQPPNPAILLSIVVGNGSVLPIILVGDMVLPGPFYLNNVLVTLDIIKNLLFIHQFTTDNWCLMEFDPFGLSVKDLSTSNVITRYNSFQPLYIIRHSLSRPEVSSGLPRRSLLVDGYGGRVRHSHVQ